MQTGLVFQKRVRVLDDLPVRKCQISNLVQNVRYIRYFKYPNPSSADYFYTIASIKKRLTHY